MLVCWLGFGLNERTAFLSILKRIDKKFIYCLISKSAYNSLCQKLKLLARILDGKYFWYIEEQSLYGTLK